MRPTDRLDQAARAIGDTTSLVVGAGAGMGVDSGLPDFRGQEGFWRAYPPLERLGLRFEESANPALFTRDPRLGWGFYGHRSRLYQRTTPHAGFDILRQLSAHLGVPYFVITSNVDGHFQRAGFDPGRVYEVHGSIHHLQCFGPCRDRVWTSELELEVDEERMELTSELPRCPACGGIARPNILMFGDWSWIGDRYEEQAARYARFLATEAGARPVYIEIGAGTAVPTLRAAGEQLAARGATVVRINLRDAEIESPHVGLAAGALEALRAIGERLGLTPKRDSQRPC